MNADRAGDATAETVAAVLAEHDWRWDIRNSVTGDGVRIACTALACEWTAERDPDAPAHSPDVWDLHRAHVAAAVVAALAEAGTERPEGTTVTEWRPQRGTVEDDLRSRLGCVIEATYWDRPYEERIAAIQGMCDLTTDGMTPKSEEAPR